MTQRTAPSRRLRVGIVGIGFGQAGHLPAFQADERCEVVAICASHQNRAAAVAARHGIAEAYGDWRSLVEAPHIDALAIATPPGIQAEIAAAALVRGKPVFCEKPLAATAAQAGDLAMLARAKSIANMVDFEFPDIEAWQRTKSLLEQEKIGKLRHVAVAWNVENYANRVGLDSWKTRTEEGGGTLNAFVSHSLHYIEWLLGDIKRLSARLAVAPGDRRTGDTLAALCLELESGLVVQLTASSDAFMGHGHHLEFYGDQGTLVLENPTSDYVSGFQVHLAMRATSRYETLTTLEINSPNHDGRVAIVSKLARRFVDWIQSGVPQKPDFADGWRVQHLIDLARQSDRTGCWVSITSEKGKNG